MSSRLDDLHDATAAERLDTVGHAPWWRRLYRWHALSAVVVVIAFACYRWHWGTLQAFVDAIDYDRHFLQDFLGHYYPMGRQILADATPVAGYAYTSFFALLMAPIGALDESTAVVVWTLVQALSLGLLCAVSARGLLFLTPLGTAVAVALFVTSLPVLSNLKWGQVSVPVMAFVIASMAALRRGRSIPAGVLLGVAAAIKLYPAVFAVYFVLQRDRRALLTFVSATALCYAVVPISVLGVASWWQFETAVAAVAGNIDVAANINSQYLANVGLRWFFLATDRQPEPLLIDALRWLGYGIGAGCVVLAALLQRSVLARRHALPVVAGLVALPFVIKTSWPHYLVYLPVCQLALWRHFFAVARAAGASTLRRVAWFGSWALVGCSMFLASVWCFELFDHWSTYNGYGVLCVANALLLPPLLLAVALARGCGEFRRPAAQRPVSTLPDA